jgi:anti-sigma factor RsiW
LIEEELITDYVYGRLTASERQLFDEHYSATPERRKRIMMAMNWKRVVSDPSRKQVTEPVR